MVVEEEGVREGGNNAPHVRHGIARESKYDETIPGDIMMSVEQRV